MAGSSEFLAQTISPSLPKISEVAPLVAELISYPLPVRNYNTLIILQAALSTLFLKCFLYVHIFV